MQLKEKPTRISNSIAAWAIVSILSAQASAQDTAAQAKEEPVDLDSLDEEQAVDLDSLEEDTGPGKAGHPAETLLPITVTNVEVERNKGLILVALAVLVPVAAMLFPPKRKRRKKTSTAGRNKHEEKKET